MVKQMLKTDRIKKGSTDGYLRLPLEAAVLVHHRIRISE